MHKSGAGGCFFFFRFLLFFPAACAFTSFLHRRECWAWICPGLLGVGSREGLGMCIVSFFEEWACFGSGLLCYWLLVGALYAGYAGWLGLREL